MSADAAQEGPNEAVAEYKRVLQAVLERRPSGTRQRLALTLSKNRSFISQITNPVYSVPIPHRHLETIFEVCHFSPEERRRFLAAYHRAHPQRLRPVRDGRRMRAHTVMLPDLGDAERNRQLDALLADFIHGLARFIDRG
ncbi:MAG: hypothetical protein JSR21_02870 [Proteobacteria bacterium]|nr:hypothetical protein [Pseudomonadota bacterium]